MARGARHTIAVGQAAPDLRLDSLEGGTHTLTELLAEGPALLAFYKVSCPTCQLTLPFLDRLAAAGLKVYAVCQNDADSAREFNEEYGVVKSRTLLDHADSGYPASNAYGITHVPSMFLVEPSGSVEWQSVGFLKKDLEALGQRFGVTIFQASDRVPDWKGG